MIVEKILIWNLLIIIIIKYFLWVCIVLRVLYIFFKNSIFSFISFVRCYFFCFREVDSLRRLFDWIMII